MEEWRTRHLRGRKKGKGDVVCSIYEFLTDAKKVDATNFLCNFFLTLMLSILLLLSSSSLRPMISIGRPRAGPRHSS